MVKTCMSISYSYCCFCLDVNKCHTEGIDCQNGGVCDPETDHCQCPNGYVGHLCEVKTSDLKDECLERNARRKRDLRTKNQRGEAPFKKVKNEYSRMMLKSHMNWGKHVSGMAPTWTL